MGIVVFVIAEIVLLLAGLGALLKPELMWKIEHFLDVRGGEPTDFYLFMSRVGAVICFIGMVILPLTPPGMELLGLG